MSDWEEIPLAKNDSDWEEIDHSAILDADKPGKLESGARGLAQGATFGWADEIAGAVEGALTDKTYEQARDESRANFKKAKEANPNTYLAGELGGSVATAAVPGLGAANTLRGALALGAGIGAASGAGNSEAESADGLAKDTLLGLGVGGAGAGVGYGVAKAVPWAAKTAGEKLKALAEMRAVKSLGGSKKMLENLKKTPGAESRLGRTLLDKKVVTPLAGKEKMAERLSGVVDDKIDDLTGVIDDVSKAQGKMSPENALRMEAAKFSPAEAAEALKNELRQKYSHIPEDILAPQLEAIDKWLNKTGRMDIKDVQAFKTQMQNFIKDGSYLKSNPGLAQETLKGIRSQLKTGVEKNADEFASIMGEQGGQIKSINQDLGGLFQGQDMVDDAIARGAKNRTVSLTDYISGGAGAEVAGPMGMAAALGNKVVREKGSQVSAVAMDKAAKFLLKTPKFQTLAKTNPPAFRALATSIAERVKPPKVAGNEPMSDEESKAAFVEGN